MATWPRILPYSLAGFRVRKGEISISFLPLSHVTARHVDFAMLSRGVTLAYVSSLDHFPRRCWRFVRRSSWGCRGFTKRFTRQVVSRQKAFPKNGFTAGLWRWAGPIETRFWRIKRRDRWRGRFANRLVYSKVRAGMGGRAEIFISGGAPLGRELAEWYADIGIRIDEGYGLTETSPVIAVNSPQAHKLGTVGKPLPNVEVRIAKDGEILVRGPSVFQGLLEPAAGDAGCMVDGWFKTGDIGKLDADGFLSITDRKKDLIKTSGGKFIAPQPLENSLKHNALIAEAVVVGDKRKFPAVLIAPYFPLLEDWARANQVRSLRGRN